MIGTGPGGLYFALLAKKADPTRHIEVFERNAAGDTFGWGIVFSDQALDNLRAADAATHRAITQAFRHWDDIDVHYRGECLHTTGHGFAGIARTTLLDILRAGARELGVIVHDNDHIGSASRWAGFDLVVGADGVHSVVRAHGHAQFRPQVQSGRNRFVWLGTSHRFDAFNFDVRETAWGWFVLHGYRYANDASTVVIETDEATWRRAGLDGATTDASIAFCERLFAERLGGERLVANPRHRSTSEWTCFDRLHCERWYVANGSDNLVLLGDAAHTAHFSIGSGTRLAMEDAIALARCLDAHPDVAEIGTALASYQAEREPEALKIVNAARNRMQWFENLPRYTQLDPLQFTYSLLTGSQRIGHDNLRRRDPGFVAKVDAHIAQQAGVDATTPPPPMFTPFRLRELTLSNRVVVSPMAMYSAVDGMPNDFHLAHLGERALGGAGLVMTEATYASADGRITTACTGLWNDAQEAAWKRIVGYVHARSTARIGIQLGHAGPKGGTPVPCLGGTPTPGQSETETTWPLFAASAQAYDERSDVPRAMTRDDMIRIRDQMVSAVLRADCAGFDLLELHCAHGYLLSSFLSPLTNRRTDDYGGSIENRLRYPLEVFAAMRAVWPQHKPMSVRISAHDWAPGGNTDADAVVIASAFKHAGADLIDVSSGQTTPLARPVYGRMYQTPFAERIRFEAGIATMAVGNIYEADHVNSIIAAGRADLCAIARPHLADPHWTLRAAAAQGYRGLPWPSSYERARAQLESHLKNST